jgi:hypothetical protein
VLSKRRRAWITQAICRCQTKRRERGSTAVAPSKRTRTVEPASLSPLVPALHALCELLKKSHKRGMIIGGVAASLLGEPRLTADIDATVVLDEGDVDEFLRQASTVGLSPRIAGPVEFLRRSAMLLLKHDATGMLIDINQSRLPFEHQATARSKIKRLGSISIPIPTPEDLIIMKAVAHRPKDLEDIRGIVESQARLDIVYIRKHVQEFGHALDMPELWSDINQLLTKRASRSGKGRRNRGKNTQT